MSKVNSTNQSSEINNEQDDIPREAQIALLVNDLHSSNIEKLNKASQKAVNMILQDSNCTSSTIDLIRTVMISSLTKSIEQSNVVIKVLITLIKKSSQFRVSIMKSGFVDSAINDLGNFRTEEQIQLNILDIIIHLINSGVNPEDFRDILHILIKKEEDKRQGKQQISQKASLILDTLERKGVRYEPAPDEYDINFEQMEQEEQEEEEEEEYWREKKYKEQVNMNNKNNNKSKQKVEGKQVQNKSGQDNENYFKDHEDEIMKQLKKQKEWFQMQELDSKRSDSIELINPAGEIDLVTNSTVLSLEQKIFILLQLLSKIQTMNNKNLKPLLDFKLFTSLKKGIGNCTTLIQTHVLVVLEIICLRASQMFEMIIDDANNVAKTVYLDVMHFAGLFGSVRELVQKQETNSGNLSPYVSIQLVRIYLLMIFGELQVSPLRKTCANVIRKSLNAIVEKLKCYNQLQEQEQQDIIASCLETFKCFKFLSQDKMNNALDYFVKEVKLHEYISPFLHLNCMALKCTRNIAIPIDQFSIQFHSQVFGMFERLIVYNEVRVHLMEKHGIFANVAPMLASFLQSSSFHGQQENNKEVQLSSTSISFDVISELIPFIHTFLDNNRDGSEIASFTPEFLTSMLKIMKYKRNEYVRNDQHYNFDNQKPYNFRRQSIQCLGCIIQQGGIECQQKLITDGFIREISDVFGSSSGEIFNRVIEEAIIILTNFYYGFCNGRLLFQKQPEMKKQSDELIEEFGIIEECECHLYRRKRNQWGHVRFRAKKLKFLIDNNYMDPKNVKFQHFILHGIMDEEESEDEDDQFHIGVGYDPDYGINQLSDEQYWNLMHGGGQMFNQQDDYEDNEDYY